MSPVNRTGSHMPTRGLTLRDLVTPLIICAILGGAMLTQVWVHQQIISLAYSISDLRAAQARLLLQKAEIEVALAAHKTPQRLINAAEVVHHLHPPRADQLLVAKGKP